MCRATRSGTERKEQSMNTKLDEILQELQQPFRPSDVYWKPGSVSKEGTKALALPYATLRAYQQRLDTICGGDWSVTYTPWGDRIICHLTLHGVIRSSTGEADNQQERSEIAGGSPRGAAEAQAFKRACSMFGLGRYLYHMPNLWVAYDPGTRQFTDQAKTKLEGVVASHYQRSTGQVVEEGPTPQVEGDEVVTKPEAAAENAILTKLRKQFDTLGNELYGERWAEVSRHNVARLTENQTDDPSRLTVEQMQKLINGMKQLKRQQRTAKPQPKGTEADGGE